MTADPMQRACEMLAAELDAKMPRTAKFIRSPAFAQADEEKQDTQHIPASMVLRLLAQALTREEEVRGEERERCAMVAATHLKEDRP